MMEEITKYGKPNSKHKLIYVKRKAYHKNKEEIVLYTVFSNLRKNNIFIKNSSIKKSTPLNKSAF